MKSKAITTIVMTLFLASMLSMAFNIAPVNATPPTTASGTWFYTPYIIYESMRFADGNTFFDATSVDSWTGTFDSPAGKGSNCVYSIVIYKKGSWYMEGLGTFVGTVNGEEGTLVMRLAGKKTVEPPLWSGKWVILSGTGDLANLRGQGTWWGPGAPAEGEEGWVSYSGQIHFEPD